MQAPQRIRASGKSEAKFREPTNTLLTKIGSAIDANERAKRLVQIVHGHGVLRAIYTANATLAFGP